MTSLLLAQIAEDPNKVIGLAKTISDQSLAAIIVLLVGLCLGGMGLMVKVFLAKIDKKDAVIEKTLQDYSRDSAAITNAVEDLKDAVKDNTSVMTRIQNKLQASVGVLITIGALFTGCASSGGGGWTVERFAVLAKSVATEASIIHLEEKPQHRQTIELVVEQLNISIAADLYTPARLAAILKPLGIRELAGREGRIAIAGTIVIYDLITASVDTTADPKKLKPIFEGIRDGFQAALDATK